MLVLWHWHLILTKGIAKPSNPHLVCNSSQCTSTVKIMLVQEVFPGFVLISSTQQTCTAAGYHPNFGFSNPSENKHGHQLSSPFHSNSHVPQLPPFTPLNLTPSLVVSSVPGTAPNISAASTSPIFTRSSPIEWSLSLSPPLQHPPQLLQQEKNVAPGYTDRNLPPFLPQDSHVAAAPLMQESSNNQVTKSVKGNRSQQGGGKRRGAKEKRGKNNARNEQTPTPGVQENHSLEEIKNRPRKKGRNRAMNAQEKLVLIRECCEHADEYKLGNKTAFWAMISQLLKEQTGYELSEPQNTIFRWVKALNDELVQEEMGSGTQVEQDDFKAAVKQFGVRLNAVQKELANAVKSKETQAAELFEAAWLQRAMVFELDDEPIPGIDSGASGSGTHACGTSIALNSSRKQKRDRDFGSQREEVSGNVVLLLAETFEKSTNVLAKALLAQANPPTSESPNFPLTTAPAKTTIAPTAPSLAIAPSSVSTAIPLSVNNTVGASGSTLVTRMTTFESELGDVKSELGDVKSELGDVKNMLGKILVAVSGGQLPNAGGENSL